MEAECVRLGEDPNQLVKSAYIDRPKVRKVSSPKGEHNGFIEKNPSRNGGNVNGSYRRC